LTILSLHIHKTAGTSFREALQHAYGTALLLNYENADSETTLPPGLTPDIKCIHGHFRPGKYTGIFPNATWITWLRDPAQRIMSQYHQYINHPNPDDPGSRGYFIEKQIGFEEFIAIPNFQNQVSKLMDPLDATKFAFIGLVEQFELSISRLSEMMDVALPVPRFMFNRNPTKQNARYEISPELERLVREYNLQDFALYEDAVNRFWKT
jgi:hypothetical protein